MGTITITELKLNKQTAASKYLTKIILIGKSRMIIWDTIMKISLSRSNQGNQIVNQEDHTVENLKDKVILVLCNQMFKIIKLTCSLIKIKLIAIWFNRYKTCKLIWNFQIDWILKENNFTVSTSKQKIQFHKILLVKNMNYKVIFKLKLKLNFKMKNLTIERNRLKQIYLEVTINEWLNKMKVKMD